MRRRIALLSLVVSVFALAATPSALAQEEPTIVTNITFPENGEPFGTFQAEEPLCPSGTFVDEFVGGGGAFRPGLPFHASTVRKTFTCDGSGTFTILFHPQFTGASVAGCEESGPFSVVGGTGAFSALRGHGDFCIVREGDEFHETFTGTFTLR